MVVPAHAQASKEVRIKQADILEHPIAEVALAFSQGPSPVFRAGRE
jgi:hypothetical protein